MKKINTPFTDEQVKLLNEYQTLGLMHPFTCNRKAEECEVKTEPRDYSKDGILIATNEGWVCPCGKYKQTWANEFMLDTESLKNSEFGKLVLGKQK